MKAVVAVLAVALLAGCPTAPVKDGQIASAGTPTAQLTTPEKLAYGYTSLREATLQAAQLRKQRILTVEDAKEVQQTVSEIKKVLDAGTEAYFLGNKDAAEGARKMFEVMFSNLMNRLQAKRDVAGAPQGGN